ncbi:MAG: transposase domain-containing protein, partial [Novosphingobium sp.]|nr:transposase domain-containing protein [Novosphingobium sp.]
WAGSDRNPGREFLGMVGAITSESASLRSIAIGRKNWLFAGSKLGGERAAAIYTVIETCKMNGVEPQAYIADVIAKIAADWPAARWDELMPWNWKASEERARLAA